MAKFLIELSDIENAQEIIHVARLYKSALELIEDRPDTAHLTRAPHRHSSEEHERVAQDSELSAA